MDFTVELINAGNYPAFADMLYWRKTGTERHPETRPTDDVVKKHLEDKNFRIFAAKADGRYVGWIALVFMPKISWTKAGFVYVDELWVAEAYRRRGIATALIKKADEMKTELLAEGVRLYVNTENPGAAALYRKCGYNGQGTAVFMEK